MSVFDRYSSWETNWLDNPKLKAAVAGITTVLLLLVLGGFIGQNVRTTDSIDPFKQALAVLFVGIATGYFLGRAVGENSSVSTAYLVGFFSTMAAVMVYLARTSPITLILGLSMITIFLMYDSNVIEKNENIDAFIFLLIEIMSALLGFLAIVHYFWPALVDVLEPVLRLVPDPVIVGTTLTVLFAVALYATWKIFPIIRNMVARLNDHLDQIRNRYTDRKRERGD